MFPINKHPCLHQRYTAAWQTQNLHTLSMFLLIPPHGKFKICIPYQCFFLPRRVANAKYQYFLPSDLQYLHTLSLFRSCHVAWQTQNGIPYHAFALRNFSRSSKLTHPIIVSVLPRRLGIPNATRYSRKAANMTSSPVFANAKQFLYTKEGRLRDPGLPTSTC